jgi:hypothetical protein
MLLLFFTVCKHLQHFPSLSVVLFLLILLAWLLSAVTGILYNISCSVATTLGLAGFDVDWLLCAYSLSWKHVLTSCCVAVNTSVMLSDATILTSKCHVTLCLKPISFEMCIHSSYCFVNNPCFVRGNIKGLCNYWQLSTADRKSILL